jgi:hypothetical protein
MNSRNRRFRSAPAIACAIATFWLAGCASQEPAANNEATDAGETAVVEAAPAMPSAFFTNLETGQTVPLEYEIIFGAENFNIVPIEDPLVVRDGEGHYHLAVDVECVTSGEIVPPGTPSYIHFGNGTDRITMQFEAGEHSLCLQVADGEHRVLVGGNYAGLIQQVTVTAAAQ